eukprot:6362354-Amphidinium_carterae.1
MKGSSAREGGSLPGITCRHQTTAPLRAWNLIQPEITIECRYSTAAPAMWPAAEHDPWGNAAAVNIWLVKLTWNPRCAWIELCQCVLAMHTLTSLQERTSPGSGTSGTEHSQTTRAWLNSEPKWNGQMSVSHPHSLAMQHHNLVEAWLDRPWWRPV